MRRFGSVGTEGEGEFGLDDARYRSGGGEGGALDVAMRWGGEEGGLGVYERG